MKNLVLKLIVLCLVVNISCQDDSDFDKGINSELELKLSDFKLSKKTLDEFLSILEFDEFDRIVSFKYDKIKEELTERRYVSFLKAVTKSKVINVYDKDDSLIYTDKTLRKEEIMAEASLYHDKRNWRRPGCKADMASICVIYN